MWKPKNSALEKFVFSELCEADDAGERLMSKEYPHKASADYFFLLVWQQHVWHVHCGERPRLSFVTFENVLHKIYVYLDVKRPAIVHHDKTLVNVFIFSWTLSFAAPSSTWP